MSKDHIIPQFILRGFALNPTAKKNNQKIMIYDLRTGNVETKKIVDSFSSIDFNSKETEEKLAHNYEYYIARIFHKIKKITDNNEKNIILKRDDYYLLIRFFVIMWRRNNIQMEKARQMVQDVECLLKNIYGERYDDIKKPEYKDCSLEDVFDENYESFRKGFYDMAINNTFEEDPTVQKTLRNYSFAIVRNNSKTHFLLHNTYATLNYLVNKNQSIITDFDMPFMMIYPISNELCFCGWFLEKEIDINYNQFLIPIEYWDNDDDIKKLLIDKYITDTATYLVVDKTNVDYIKTIR